MARHSSDEVWIWGHFASLLWRWKYALESLRCPLKEWKPSLPKESMGETPAIPSPAVQEFAATNSSGFKAQILQLISSGRFTGFFLFLTMWLGNQWQWVGFWYIRIGRVGGCWVGEMVGWSEVLKEAKVNRWGENTVTVYRYLGELYDLTHTAGWFHG